MTPERFQQIKKVFAEACRLDVAERAAYLTRTCQGDKELRVEVEALLENDQRPLPIAQRVSAAAALGLDIAGRETRAAGPLMAGATGDSDKVPERIGRYRVVRMVGAGGMGVVYEAEQENPRRTVALKIIRPGVASQHLLSRFQFEAQVLGRLHHAGIAQIYEAGTARIAGTGGPDQEQPYFVMEYIRGKPLNEFAASEALGARARLELMARICDAVQHAHQKGVIHRDLKPGNILVTDEGQPKILDFGVARLTDADVQMTTLRTDVGQLIGTVSYMSPEQVAGDSQELDTLSDVYALGVICYELLSGRLPLDLRGKTIPEAARMIADEEPTRLSTVHRHLRGDIETIVGKALTKEKERRYASAADFAADIRRYLADQPISARPASTVYQLRKFTRRNKALVAAVIAGFVALSVGLAQTTIERNRARRAETIARNETLKAQTINAFVTGMLKAANPLHGAGPDVRVRDILDDAAQRVGEDLAGQPDVEWPVRLFIGSAYRNLALYDKAEAQFRQALEIARQRLGDDDPDTLNLMHSLALVHMELGNPKKAQDLYRESLDGFLALYGEEHEATLGVMTNLVRPLAVTGRLEEAEALQRRTIELYRKLYGPEHQRTLTSLHNLSSVLRMAGKTAEVVTVLREVLDAQRRMLSDDHPYTIFTMNSLGTTLRDLNRLKEAEALHREAYGRRTRILGPTHRHTLMSGRELAVVLAEQGELAAAIELAQQNLDTCAAALGDGDEMTIAVKSSLAVMHAKAGRQESAEELASAALVVATETFGPEDERTLSAAVDLSKVLQHNGAIDEAAKDCLEVLSKAEKVPSVGGLTLAEWRLSCGSILTDGQDYEKAEALLLDALQVFDAKFGSIHRQTQMALGGLVRLYTTWGRPGPASEYEQRLSAAQ